MQDDSVSEELLGQISVCAECEADIEIRPNPLFDIIGSPSQSAGLPFARRVEQIWKNR